MKTIIVTATVLVMLGVPVMASQKNNSQIGRVQSADNTAAAGKVHFNPFSITRKIDKASPVLF